MIVARAARPAVLRTVIQNSRNAHAHNTVYNMPFDYRNKRTFAVKMVAFLGTGFAIPFIAAYYQMHKNDA
ncbi:hypothetical protein FRB94_011342 [Tulasnella sp. JGI-2019a]|nr:hypothetical protein FRB93_003278 [Tulasnella sp. JGI-2019a]KAG9009896.1 hypothetical protein FRB94_011342 [Tulasnella sp. JGI-2019a]KAG9034685.1 hypothetical protein FRB95_012870 [Tulasnella sp. JGI-2019a]